MAQSLSKPGEFLKNPLQIPYDSILVRTQVGPHVQILLDGHPRYDPPTLWHLNDSYLYDRVGLISFDLLALKEDVALFWPQDPRYGPQERALSS
ncbi:unnamed protein product, partial [marine sediment metagenome]